MATLFERVLGELLEREEAGQSLDLTGCVESHPQLADRLRAYFRDRNGFDRLAGGLAPFGIGPPAEGQSTAGDRRTDGTGTFNDIPSPPSAREPSPGTAIGGRYTLAKRIGEGGMGEVYRAADGALNREVAVKVLRSIAGRASAARRFEDEARITAQLQHPAIPPVHDIGTLPDGRPFLAMKLVKGVTLEELLKERPDRHRFIAVFEQVCHAVAYAHAHGVIHRDLKPRNVMVGNFGEVQVMDWGLAKVLDPAPDGAAVGGEGEPGSSVPQTEIRSTRGSDDLLTQAGSILGTPAFMPPEQAIGAVDQIDRRSDVFGLGGVLATILTGKPPFVGANSESTRQMAAKGKLGECFARLDGCGADPELVSLAKRCLAAEKPDRPADAAEVAKAVAALRQAADDRARHAEVELAAAGLAAAERRKRRRVWLGAAAALTVAVVGGLAAVLVVQDRARRDLAAKNDALEAERAKVEQRFDMARKAIAAFHVAIDEQPELGNEAFRPLRARLLGSAAGFYREIEALLADERDPKSRKALADGYFTFGELTEKIGDQKAAVEAYRKALAIRRGLAAGPDADGDTRLAVPATLLRLGPAVNVTGDTAGALAAFEEARGLAAALEAASPTDAVRQALAGSHAGIGTVLSQTGKPAEALAAHEAARDIRRRLAEASRGTVRYSSDLASSYHDIGTVLFQTGKPAEIVAAYEAARDIRQELADAHRDDARLKSDLAVSLSAIGGLYGQLGKPTEALAAYEKARDIFQEFADANGSVVRFKVELARSQADIGSLLSQLGNPAAALPAAEAARDIRQGLVAAHPGIPGYRADLAQSRIQIGQLRRQMGHPAEALAAYEKARDALLELVKEHRAVTRFSNDLAGSYLGLGWLLGQAGRQAEAMAAHEKARDILLSLAEANANVSDYQSDLARSFLGIGLAKGLAGEPAAGLVALKKGRDGFRKLAEAYPAVPQFQCEHAAGCHGIGLLLGRMGKPGEALAACEAARDLRQKLADTHSLIPGYQADLAASHSAVGLLLLGQRGKRPEAMAALGKSRDILRVLVEGYPDVTDFQIDLAASHTGIGLSLWHDDRLAEALAEYEAARDLRRKLADDHPAPPAHRADLAATYHAIGLLQRLLRRPAEALEAHEKGRDVFLALADAHPEFRSDLARSHSTVGWLLGQAGKPAEAMAAHKKARDIQKGLAASDPSDANLSELARSHNNIGRLYAKEGRFPEAYAALDAGLDLRRKVAEGDRKTTVRSATSLLGLSHAYRGWARLQDGKAKDAAEDLRRALELWDKDPALPVEMRFERSRALALLAKLGTDPAAGVGADEAGRFSAKEVTALAEAVRVGWANPAELYERDFDAVRGRDDFAKLLAELNAGRPAPK